MVFLLRQYAARADKGDRTTTDLVWIPEYPAGGTAREVR
jgi:hypothetical protein